MARLTPHEEEMNQTSKPYLILAGIDYSTASELALERALELTAAQPNAELHVVHVTTASDAPTPNDSGSHRTSDTALFDQQSYEQLQAYVAVGLGAFEKKQNGAAGRPVSVVSHLRAHAPAQEIAQLASDLEADLVVVGMCGRGSFARFLLGSVAESVTRLAPCPVLVFRPKGLPIDYPKIEPPCPRCVDARSTSAGKEYWCGQHRERHGQRHVYHQFNTMSEDGSLPLFLQE
jgi:nucleotide-binding universal stress UspA family protein